MTACYIQPGAPPPPPLPARANSYIQPSGPPPQSMPSPPPATPPQDDPHRALISEWRTHHGSDWVRADALHRDIRQLIDPKDRTASIRQRLRQLANAQADGFKLETKIVGNAARPVVLYRVIETRNGLEG